MDKQAQYWATLPTSEILTALESRVDDYFKYLRTTNRLYVWRMAYQTYNQAVFKGPRVRQTGRHGEYQNMTVNHFRNLLQHIVTMTINQRPSFEPRATNTDVESQSQTILARGLLDYYLREKRLERYLKDAVEYALLYGEGFVTTTWNATLGETYGVDPETQIDVKEGDIEYRSYEPVDVVRNVNVYNADVVQWYIIRKYMNKWDLAAKFPEIADKIINVNNRYDPLKQYKTSLADLWGEETIEVYELFHDRTDAVPEGRNTLFINGNVILTDGPLPYRSMPVFRVCPGNLSGTPFGYSPANDLLPLQEMADTLYSTIVTNQAAFGVQNILVPRGANIATQAVRDGMNIIEYDAKVAPPQGLNLTQTSPEIFKFVEMLERLMETISGVNSVARGNPESSLKSGAALALVQSMAVQFSQGLQQSYVQLLEDVGTGTIEILRDYAVVPRVAMIAGKSNRGQMKRFSGKDLSQINRVQVDAGNPMTRTTAGKVELATMMIQNGIIKHPEELLQVIQTGNLETMTEGVTSEMLSIKSENEVMAEGKQVPVFITDNHLLHISEHKSVVSDPAVREDPQIVQVVTDHILEHFKMLSDPANANLLMTLGQQPLPQQPPPQQAPGGLQGDNAAPTANEIAQGNQPDMPNMPTNPLTGERAQVPQQ